MKQIRSIIGWIAPQSRLSQQFPPDSTFDPGRDIPDLTGKVALVTGGNAGIGYHTVKHLLLKNAKVYLAGRSPARCADAVKQLKDDTGREPVVLNLDLADLPSVRRGAEEFLAKEERLDILYNNAGVLAPPLDRLTEQGYDLRTNVLGHYFLTTLLLPALVRSTAHHNTKSRILHVSSIGHDLAPRPTGLDWRTVKGGPERDRAIREYGPVATWRLYGASKMGNILLSHIFTRYHGDHVVSCPLHPGLLMTDIWGYAPRWLQWILGYILYPVPDGALTQLWAGTTPEAEGISGKYLIPWARVGKANPPAYNEETQDKLKEWLEAELKGY
ncbi:NAD-P-binding protein [Gautieria morchelliformis]|nr:NAD-P-binding protein [Gautieria morchelliformis]